MPCYTDALVGAWRSPVAHRYGVPVVGGSNPLAPTLSPRQARATRGRCVVISGFHGGGWAVVRYPWPARQPRRPETLRTPPMSESPGATRAWRVLIADDESLIRLDLREMLTELGYDVIGEAGDGRAALDLSRKLQPDIVIMDIKMPELDGISVAEELTREKIAPVVLLTAYSDQPLVERAREAGVVGYVVKPFRPAELLPVIELSVARFDEFRPGA